MEPVQEEVRDPWGHPRPVQAEQGRVQARQAQHLQVINLSLSLVFSLTYTQTPFLLISLYIFLNSSKHSPNVTGYFCHFSLSFFLILFSNCIKSCPTTNLHFFLKVYLTYFFFTFKFS